MSSESAGAAQPERRVGSSLVLAGVALIATCYGFARFAYGLFAPRFTDEFALSTRLTGFIGGSSYVGYCLAIGLSALLTARRGPRPVAVLAGAVATAGMTVVALAPSSPVRSWTASASGPRGRCSWCCWVPARPG